MQLVKVSGRYILLVDDGKEYDISDIIETEIKNRQIYNNLLREYFKDDCAQNIKDYSTLQMRYSTMKLHLNYLVDKAKTTSDGWFKDGNVHGHMIDLRQQVQIIQNWLKQLEV